MLFDITLPVRKPISIWEMQRVLEAVEVKITECLQHRGECAGGDYHWDDDDIKKEYFALRKKRTMLIDKVASVSLE
tara:strand:- start:276 stop:503 length:228 start_codon:yes stop_codon:yes gene_type:complete